jgi:hypothetical protein
MADYYTATGVHMDGAFSLGEHATLELAIAACERDATFIRAGEATTYRVRACWRGVYRDCAADVRYEKTFRGELATSG